MRVMKFAVVLCFTVALVKLSNYPHPVTVHGAAPKALPQFTDGLGPAYTYINDVSSPICINCHQNINHIAPLSPEGSCKDCHTTGEHGFEGAITAYHNLIGEPVPLACTACHNIGGVDMRRATSAYHKSFGLGWPIY